jgi:hypothetical protein
MHRTQFRAKSAKNYLKHTGFLKRNFYFETEGVFVNRKIQAVGCEGVETTSLFQVVGKLLENT